MNKENIMLMEFKWGTGQYEQNMVAIFNKENLPEAEARKALHPAQDNDKIIVVSKVQFENVFGTI